MRRAERCRSCASSATSRQSAFSRRLPLSFAIDHAVVAVRDLEAAAAGFRQIGFTLTPRGGHSIGSHNHPITFGANYIELLPAPQPHPLLDYFPALPRS